jgi:hypothetical protein
MRIYHGKRLRLNAQVTGTCQVLAYEHSGEREEIESILTRDGLSWVKPRACELLGPLDPRLDLRRHSPSGFDWGYGGSGPAQLALAILADCFLDSFALDHYQTFKFAHVATWPAHGFLVTEWELRGWAAHFFAAERGTCTETD